ncbi:hypothetical protein [Diplocloster hominis]
MTKVSNTAIPGLFFTYPFQTKKAKSRNMGENDVLICLIFDLYGVKMNL